MAIVNISLPDKMKDYIEERINEGGYHSTSEYFRDLVREDQRRRASDRLEAMLLRGLEAPSSEWTKDDVNYVKKAVRERLAAKNPHE